MPLGIIRAVESWREPRGFRIRYLGCFTRGQGLDGLLLALDGTNLEACVLGFQQNFETMQTKESFGSILASYTIWLDAAQKMLARWKHDAHVPMFFVSSTPAPPGCKFTNREMS